MFGTSGIRGRVGERVTGELAVAVGRAVASEGYGRVVVGRDTRETGAFLLDGVATGLRECGADVVDVGVEATPTVARAVGGLDADAGVVVTASHNPPADNGFKLWTTSGQAFDERQRAAVSRRVREREFDLASWRAAGERTERGDAADRHAAAVLDAVPAVDDCSVAVDVGNGAGQVTARVLDDLGCSVTSLNARPDGRFPSRPSEPTAEALASLREYVAATDHDLGVAHDGDADRLMAVDDDGEFVPGDELLALFARDAAGDGDEVAVPLNTSLLVDDVLDGVGATVTRTRVGDVFVAERASEPGVAFGGEPSGAWIWPDETLCPDGPLAAARVAGLVAERGPLSALRADLGEYPLRRDSVETDEKDAVVDRVASAVAEEYGDVERMDGVRVAFDDGWFLVRASGTQPLVRVTAEARDEQTVDERFRDARRLVERARADG
ncbi:phosphoglucosamine mutase [Halobacterium yunchengense]|uniref:phosphoglucosamine mutase n=1 Tax=Halobacterium yunchengense TaxID=3108497 RepID=UPI0030085AB9